MTARRIRTVGTLEQEGPLGSHNKKRQLGRSARLNATLSSNKRHMVLVYSSADRKESKGPSLGESLAQRVAITCDVKLLTHTVGVPPTGDQFNVRGRLRWGNDGHQSEVSFDWKQGTVVHPIGAAFELYAELIDAVVGTTSTLVPNVDIEVGAFIGYSGAHGGFFPTLTVIQTVGADSFLVPSFAQRVAFYGAGATFGLQWFVGATGITTTTGLTSKGVGLTIPGGGVTSVTTSGFTAATQVIAVWELAL